MSIICSSIINNEEFHAQHTTRNKLVITGSHGVPTEIHKGVVIGKGTVLKNLTAAPNSLSLFGYLDALLSDGVDQTTKFIGACYGNRVGEESMPDIRYKIWTTKFGNTATSAPKIQALPPTTEAFIEKVKRSHLQTGTWKTALSLDPPALDAVEYGYVSYKPSKILLPTTVPDGVTLAPDEVNCNCEGASACRNMRCSCSRRKLPCTLFCFVNAMLEMNV